MCQGPEQQAQLNADIERISDTNQLVKRAKAAGIPIGTINMCFDNKVSETPFPLLPPRCHTPINILTTRDAYPSTS